MFYRNPPEAYASLYILVLYSSVHVIHISIYIIIYPPAPPVGALGCEKKDYSSLRIQFLDVRHWSLRSQYFKPLA